MRNGAGASAAGTLHVLQVQATAPALMKKKLLVVVLAGYGSLPVGGQTRIEQLNNLAMAMVRRASTYHGYKYETRLSATFVGQDGQSYAGEGCSVGTTPNNAHITLAGMTTGVQPTSFELEDLTHSGKWASPCDPVSNWLLAVRNVSGGNADLYFRPFVIAEADTLYRVTVRYADGSSQALNFTGSAITP